MSTVRLPRYGKAPEQPIIVLDVLNLPGFEGWSDASWWPVLPIWTVGPSRVATVDCPCGVRHRLLAEGGETADAALVMRRVTLPVSLVPMWLGRCAAARVIYWSEVGGNEGLAL